MKYILKNGTEVESVPVGKTKIQIGEKRNRLTVCDRGTNGNGQKTRVICQCDCGNYTIINLQDSNFLLAFCIANISACFVVSVFVSF